MGGFLGAGGSLTGAFFEVGSRIGRFFIARRFAYKVMIGAGYHESI